MFDLELLIKETITYLEHYRFDVDQLHFVLHAGFALYVIHSLRWFKRRLRRLHLRARKPASRPEDDNFVTVSEVDLLNYRAPDSNYDVPKQFPCWLESYVKNPSFNDLAEWILETGDYRDPAKQDDIRRAITVSAAFHKTRLPKQLVLVDSRAKALWVRLKFDLELKAIDKAYVAAHVVGNSNINDVPIDNKLLGEYNQELIRIGALVLKYSEKGNFPSFAAFARILTGYSNVSKDLPFSDEELRSMVTAYAVKAKLPIPASYIRCDLLTLYLLGHERSAAVVSY